MSKYLKILIWIAFFSSVLFLYYRLTNKEGLAWKSATDSNTIAAYTKYLQEYEHNEGVYVNVAKYRIDSLSLVGLYESGLRSSEMTQVEDIIDSLNVCRNSQKFDLSFYDNKITQLKLHLDDLIAENELKLYEQACNSSSLSACAEFLQFYPKSSYAPEIKKKYDALKYEDDARVAYNKITTSAQCDSFLKKYGKSSLVADVRDKKKQLLEEEYKEKYKNNSLRTGATPWANKFGGNPSCYYDYSNIIIRASNTEDAVVTVKKGDASGRVVRHAYIKAGDSYTFEVPNGRYTVFFYSGKGWNPYQVMNNGLKGGFISNTSVTKSDPEYLNNVEWTITLYTTYNGNFSPKTSSIYEMLN